MKDSLPNMDEVKSKLEEIKTYDDKWWLGYLKEHTIFDTENIKAQKDFLIESLGLLIEERERRIIQADINISLGESLIEAQAEIEHLKNAVRYWQEDSKSNSEHASRAAGKVAEQDKEIQRLKEIISQASINLESIYYLSERDIRQSDADEIQGITKELIASFNQS